MGGIERAVLLLAIREWMEALRRIVRRLWQPNLEDSGIITQERRRQGAEVDSDWSHGVVFEQTEPDGSLRTLLSVPVDLFERARQFHLSQRSFRVFDLAFSTADNDEYPLAPHLRDSRIATRLTWRSLSEAFSAAAVAVILCTRHRQTRRTAQRAACRL